MTSRDSTVTVGDVLNAFPLAKFGRYHIRFRKNNSDSYEWAELLDESMPAPTYNGGIFLKVLDLGASLQDRIRNRQVGKRDYQDSHRRVHPR